MPPSRKRSAARGASSSKRRKSVSRQHLTIVPRSSARIAARASRKEEHKEFNNEDKPVWLDNLPLEVCEQIAMRVANGGHEPDALKLAKTSEKQADAVANSLHNCFRVYGRGNNAGKQKQIAEQKEWVDIYESRIKNVEVDEYWRDQLKFTVRLLSADGLKTVNIPANYHYLKALAGRSNVKNLTLRIDEKTSLDLLVDVLNSLELNSLSITCTPKLHNCVFVKYSRRKNGLKTLADAIHGTKNLEVSCECDYLNDATWSFIGNCRDIDTLSLVRTPEEGSLPMLRGIPNIKFINVCSYGLDTVVTLGTSVTVLKWAFHNQPLTSQETKLLSACTRVRKLCLTIVEGSDSVLAETLKNMPELESLSLTWRPGENGLPVNVFLAFIFKPTIDATPGALLNAVKNCPNLSELTLRCVSITICELKEVLKTVGKRLTSLSLSIERQPESEVERLIAILSLVNLYNPELKNLCLDGIEALNGFPQPKTLLQLKCAIMGLERSTKVGNVQKIWDKVNEHFEAP